MIATLAFFFYANNGAQPSSGQKRELKKWFWATSVASRYTGKGYRQNLLSDIAFFERLGKKRNGRFPFRDLVSVTEAKQADS